MATADTFFLPSDATLSTLLDSETATVSANQSAAVDGMAFFPLIKQPMPMIVVYTVAYGVVFLLSVVGNGLVVCVVFRTPSMRSVTNYFIVNLAVADLLVGWFCLPITLLANLFSGQ